MLSSNVNNSNNVLVATHNGAFHADEVVAGAIISLVKGDVVFNRSRSPEVHQRADYVLDVGGQYDPESGLFDHHQRGFDKVRDNGILYATAGLVWGTPYFYTNVINFLLNGMEGYDPEVHLEAIQQEIDKTIMQPVDSIDTGHYRPEEGTYHFSQAISALNSNDIYSEEQYDSFLMAVEMAKKVLIGQIKRTAKMVIDQYELDRLIEEQKGNQVLELPRYFDVSSLRNNDMGIKRVVWPDKDGYKITALAEDAYFPQEWRGLSGEALNEASGIDSCIFCHPAGFIAGNKTKEGAMEMANF